MVALSQHKDDNSGSKSDLHVTLFITNIAKAGFFFLMLKIVCRVH